jgi:hypothetical protein
MAFEEEGALDLGAIRHVRHGRVVWLCSPPCEKEFLAEPSKFEA